MSQPNITNLRHAHVESATYFVDANIWIYSLQKFEDLEHWENSYYQFFFDIIDSTLTPKPTIALTTMLLSEIINTYLRKFAIPEFKQLNSIPAATQIDFKRDYRPTQHYVDSYEKIIDDIQSLSGSIKFISDAKVIGNRSILFNKNVRTFDYNDYIFYSICQELNKDERVIILTNDGDYRINDIELVTGSKQLLAL